MKAMYKYELARAAGVSTRTLSSFIEINKEQIERDVGIQLHRHAKILPPGVVKWISEHYCIDI